LILEVRGVVVDIGGESGLLLIMEARGGVVDNGGERGVLLVIVGEREGGCLYQQQHPLTSNINNNPSHLHYQQQPPLTSNINNNPLSPPI
jgi:hypothetical protein